MSREIASSTTPIVETDADIAGGHVPYVRIDGTRTTAESTNDDGTTAATAATAVADADVLAAVRENTEVLSEIRELLKLLLSALS